MENPPEIKLYWLAPAWPTILASAAGFFASVWAVDEYGGFGSLMLLLLMVIAGVPVALLSIWIGGASEPPRRSAVRILPSALLPAVLVVAAFVGLLAGQVITEIRIETAQHWCDGLIPRLEAWRARTGEYPSDLALLGPDLDPPKFCRDGGLLYRALPNGYEFDFFDGGGLYSGYEYSSVRGIWNHYSY